VQYFSEPGSGPGSQVANFDLEYSLVCLYPSRKTDSFGELKPGLLRATPWVGLSWFTAGSAFLSRNVTQVLGCALSFLNGYADVLFLLIFQTHEVCEVSGVWGEAHGVRNHPSPSLVAPVIWLMAPC
jgi:hypothetical protein